MSQDIDAPSIDHITSGAEILPIQYYEALRRSCDEDPYRRLLLAILTDAVGCYQRPTQDWREDRGHGIARTVKAKNEAARWLLADDGYDPFSFTSTYILDALGIDAQWFRAGVRAWKGVARSLKRLRPSNNPAVRRIELNQPHTRVSERA